MAYSPRHTGHPFSSLLVNILKYDLQNLKELHDKHVTQLSSNIPFMYILIEH